MLGEEETSDKELKNVKTIQNKLIELAAYPEVCNQPIGFKRGVRRLVGTDSSINLIKESHLFQNFPKEAWEKKFQMVNDTQTAMYKAVINYINENHIIYIVYPTIFLYQKVVYYSYRFCNNICVDYPTQNSD